MSTWISPLGWRDGTSAWQSLSCAAGLVHVVDCGRYALGAALLKQLTFMESMRHKAVVLEVAGQAESLGCTPQLAVIYDDLIR
jgi:hypothetical protein